MLENYFELYMYQPDKLGVMKAQNLKFKRRKRPHLHRTYLSNVGCAARNPGND